MKQGWVEFENISGKKVSLRPKYIGAILEKVNHTDIYYDQKPIIDGKSGKLTTIISIIEPYEQVKQKIIDVEKVNLSDVEVEHFTIEEYKILEDVMIQKLDQLAEDEPCTSNYYDHSHLLDKLNEILKEKEK